MKKVLSLVLVAAMVLSSMSFAFAATFEDTADTDYSDAIETLYALGIVTGYEDGTYRPEETVTRAEMAKLMVEILGYGDLVTGSKSNFTDTQGHWADSWIAIAAGRNIVVGTGDGKFTPDAEVTYDEVLTMIVRGLGYTDSSNEISSMTWPTNFKVKAAELGITDDVSITSEGADRGGVAQALYNALEATLVTVDTDGDIVKEEDSGGDYVELLSRIAELDTDYDVTPEVLDPDNNNYAGNYVDLMPYMFQNLDVYLNDDDEVVYVRESNSLTLEGTVDEVDGLVLSIEEEDGSVKDVDFDIDDSIIDYDDDDDPYIDASYIYENGAIKESDVDLDDFEDFETITVVANDDEDLGGDGDGKLEADEIAGIAVTYRTEVERIEEVYSEGDDSLDGIDLPVGGDDEVDLDGITVKGDVDSLEDIEVDDIVAAYASEDESAIILVVTRNSVDGTVTRVYDSDTFYIDGTSYDVASQAIVDSFDLGDEGIFYLDQFGEIADYDGESAGPTDYGVIFGAANGDLDERFGLSVDTYPELKVATQDGEEVIYEVAVEINDDGTVDESAEITDSSVSSIDEGEIFDGTYEENDELDIESIFSADAYLIQYSLDSADRIDEIEVIADVSEYVDDTSSGLNEVDLDDDSVIDSVIVFDGGDDFDVVDIDSLDTSFNAYAVEDDDGDIEVLVVQAGEVDEAATQIYAYLNKITETYDDDGDKVNEYVLYVDGEKKDVMSDDNIEDVATYNQVISFDYDGDVIDESDVDLDVDATTATAIDVNRSRGRIELDFGDSASYEDGWYDLSEHGTIIEIDPDDDSVNSIEDLSDIDEDDVIDVYINSDGDIDLIVITED